MQAPRQTGRIQAKSVVALLLTFTAGMVDIVGYILVYHVFVAHMTGTTVHLGNKLLAGDWTEVAKMAVTIGSFVAGSVVGRIAIERGSRVRNRTVATITLLAEAALVLVFVWIEGPTGDFSRTQTLGTICGLLALLATAMGLQTATLTRIGPLTIHTTFVTGMLNKFAQAVSNWLFWMHDEWRKQQSLAAILERSGRHAAFRNARFMAVIWLCYMGGAIAGTWMNSHWQARSLYLPVGILVLAAIIDQMWPLSLEEEQEQA
jgi:uncharacterized membrane protein YoaK (UPF0700 family)